MKKYTTEIFVEKSKKIHGNKYDYSKVNYLNNDTKVIVICKLHGDFLITPKNHLLGQGCKDCGYLNRNNRRSNLSEFIQKANLIHKNTYNYSLTNYETARKKIEIICNIHGVFKMLPSNHLNGQGCKKCSDDLDSFRKTNWIKKSKTKRNRKGIFYIIKCWNEEELFFKFGITFNSVKERYISSLMPYNYEILRQIESSDLEYIWKLEKRFKKFKHNFKYLPNIKFPGHLTECFK